MAEDHLDLASEFSAADDTAWRAAVEKALGGRPFEKAMQSASYDGIPLHALYTRDSAWLDPQPAGREGEWQIIAPHWNPDAVATNAAILEDLERGATGIALKIAAGTQPGVAVADVPVALQGVYLTMARLELLPGEEFEAATAAATALFDSIDGDAADIHASLGVDPLGTLAASGRLLTPAGDAVAAGAAMANDLAARYAHVTTFTTDASLYHSAGATEAQELGIALSTGLAYLRAMETAGMSLEDAFKQIRFTLAADADLFLTIAKFRAFRRLWARVAGVCGVEPVKAEVGAVSALRMYSIRDPWVNILRGTAACFAAGVGGADGIAILPHDTMIGLSTPFARRIARNIQIILQEESSLSRVADASAGAFAIETITSELAAKGWDYFQKLEAVGGAIDALSSGKIAGDLENAWSVRLANVSKRKDAVTGVSEFPDIHEKPVEPLAVLPPLPEAPKTPGVTLEALPMHRLAAPFEELRDKSDAMEAASGDRPSVFLANLGPVAAHTARATFAKNFFEAGGIEALPSVGFSDVDALVKAFAQSGATIAVICGRDDDYQTLGLSAAKALKGAGCQYLYLAGRPADTAPFEAAGTDRFIYLGCDVIEALHQAYSILGGEK